MKKKMQIQCLKSMVTDNYQKINKQINKSRTDRRDSGLNTLS